MNPASNLTLFALLVVPALLPHAPAQDLRAQFEALDEKRDKAGIVQLWKDNPGHALGVIDSYLEGSLARLEKDPATDPAQLLAMKERALRGARAADQAFGTCIFSDYASSFATWGEPEHKRFREGQSLFGTASKQLREGDLKTGLASARASLELARPLGDWWGCAMALGAMARAEGSLFEYEASLEHAGTARVINHDLRLFAEEADNLNVAAAAADGLGRSLRALVLAQDGLALARQLKDRERQARFLGQILKAQEKLGDKAGAEQTREEYRQLPPAPPQGKQDGK